MFGCHKVQVQAHIFIGGVRASAGIARASRHDRHLERLLENCVGARTAHQGDDLLGHAVNIARAFHHQFYERIVRVGAGGGFAAQERYLNIFKPLGIQVGAQLFQHHFGRLVGHKPEIDLGAGFGWQHRFGAWPLVT